MTTGFLLWAACGETDTNTPAQTGGAKPTGGSTSGGRPVSGGVPGTGGVVASPTGGDVEPGGGRDDAGGPNLPSGGPNLGGGGGDGTGGTPGEGGGGSPSDGGGGSADGGTGDCASATDAEQCAERGCYPVTVRPWLRIGGMGGAGGFGPASECMEEQQDEEYVGCALGSGGDIGACYCRKGNYRNCTVAGPEVAWVSDDWVGAPSCDYVGCTRFK